MAIDDLLLANFLGSIGVAMLLAAFALHQGAWLRADGLVYLSANAAGAGLACVSAYLIGFVPFVVLEGIWAAVAAAALWRSLIAGRRTRHLPITRGEPK